MAYVYAFLAAVFAALTAIFAKIGITGINSHLATAIRTVVVLALAWGLVFALGAHRGIPEITRKGWIFLILSGLATGASWLFYYKALQIGDVTRVSAIDKTSAALTIALAIIFLGEPCSAKAVVGAILLTLGALVTTL